jgi:hypothetical protein
VEQAVVEVLPQLRVAEALVALAMEFRPWARTSTTIAELSD